MRTDHRERYDRQLRVREFGEAGQERLCAARIAVVGAGGLGSPALLYLAAAGVGVLGLIEGELVELSNLNRQIAHRTAALGRSKADSAAAAVEALNPEVSVRIHRERLSPLNALEILRDYDVVVDATDNIGARYLINDACLALGLPWVHGAVLRLDGQMTVFSHRDGGPCYRCLYPVPPAPGAVPGSAEVGILGPVPGVIGALQALEAIKLATGLGSPLHGQLLLFSGAAGEFTRVRIERDPACPACGAGDGAARPEPGVARPEPGASLPPRPEYEA